MSEARHFCRNPRCRMKLPAAVQNLHKACCTLGCHESFYLSRCLVCEDQMIRKRSNQRIKSGHGKCSAEYQRFPHVYDFRGPTPAISNESLAEAHSMGLKTRVRPTHRCLREWFWTDEIDLELQLQDQAGQLLAWLEHNRGRYRLTHPRTIPIQSWPNLGQAKHAAESFALMALPLDPATKARLD